MNDTGTKLKGRVTPVIKYAPYTHHSGTSPLLQVSTAVQRIDDALLQLVADLSVTLYFYDAVGISAPQIGALERVILVRSDSENAPLVMINPEIRNDDVKLINGMEGCISFPGIFAPVLRPESATVHYTNVLGEEVSGTFSGLTARAIYHEVDHLDGKLFISHMSPTKRNLVIDKLKKQFKDGSINNDTTAIAYMDNLREELNNNASII